MNSLLKITKTEILLIARSKFTYVIAIVLVYLGIWQATAIRGFPIGIWTKYVAASSAEAWLILTFWGIGQALRKQDKQVGKMIWSTATPF